jgi:alkylhydroperoxidase family enzyme
MRDSKGTLPVIPYVAADLKEPAALISAIRARRGGDLLHLDRMLLHSIPFAKGWNAFLLEVRKNLSLSPQLREIAMCGVAVLNGAEYEFIHHAPELIAAGGNQAQVNVLKTIADQNFTVDQLFVFDQTAQDTVLLTIAMTRSIRVDPALIERLQTHLGNTATVELVGVIATYNMVSRFLVALGVTPEDQQ